MTLDEAIKHCNEVACKHDKCAMEHKQLAQWLIELKGYKEQKLTNKVEPKFNVGDWLQYGNAKPFFVEEITKQGYINGDSCLPFNWENEIHLWTIQDAKDGDVLFTSSTASHETFIFKSIDERGNTECYFAYDSEDGFREGKYHFIGSAINCKPATKEQYDTLMKVMTDRGYTFDFKKKELKKIEQNPAWSEEDEKQARQIERIVHDDGCTQKLQKQIADWFKSLKDRVRPQNITITDEELAQAKKDAYENVLDKIEYDNENPTFDDGWSAAIWYLKKRTAQPQSTWKPSDEQMEALEHFVRSIGESGYASPYDNNTKVLYSLLSDLKKLK